MQGRVFLDSIIPPTISFVGHEGRSIPAPAPPCPSPPLRPLPHFCWNMPTSLPNHDIDAACRQSAAAFAALANLPADSRAAILDAIAAALDLNRDHILQVASDETALTIEELTPEFARTTGTLSMFAALVRDGSWCRAAIDTVIQNPRGHAGATETARAQPPHDPIGPGVTAGVPYDQPIGPNHDLRSLLIPLGPVAVFGSSNFPLAYGVCGGDTASALAAGCPVIIKEHPAHPKTGRLLAGIARAAIQNPRGNAGATKASPQQPTFGNLGAPDHLLQYIHNESPTDFSIAQQLVQHDNIKAVGFTGSIPGGLAIEKLARERTIPIPVFAEMGSANRVVIYPAALKNRGPAIAAELAVSILARHGQQCTKPGLIALSGDRVAGPAFVAELARLLDAATPRRMLSARVTEEYVHRCRRLSAIPDLTIATDRTDPEAPANAERRTAPMLFAAMDFDRARYDLDALQMFTPEGRGYWLNDEIFGPAAIVFGGSGAENFCYASPALATTIYADPDDMDELLYRDDPEPPELEFWLQRLINTTGRITFNGPPTGVRVATSMVHGGPFPATNAPHTTAVGPRAIERWCRPLCYQNCPDALLPAELQNANPRALWRTVNGELTRSPIL